MEEKLRDFVHFNDDSYSSYGDIKTLFFCVCCFMTLLVGTFAVVAKRYLFLLGLLSVDCAFLFHLISLKYFWKNTYSLRFVSNGIVDALLSCLFLICAYTVLSVANSGTTVLKCGIFAVYTVGVSYPIWKVIRLAKSGKYSQVDQRFDKTKGLRFCGFLIPVSGVLGIAIAEVIFGIFQVSQQLVAYVSSSICIIISMLFSIGNVNFIKYYYCKKYNILCDENGNTTSPKLEPQAREKRPRRVRPPKTAKKKIPLPLKILIGILAVPIAFFVVVFMVAVVKVISNRM